MNKTIFGLCFIYLHYCNRALRIFLFAVLETAPINIGYPLYENIVARRAIVLVFPHPGGPWIKVIFYFDTVLTALICD